MAVILVGATGAHLLARSRAATQGTTSTFIIGSYNLLHAVGHPVDSKAVGNCAGPGDGAACILSRTQKQAKVINGSLTNGEAFGVATLSEVSQPQYADLIKLLPNYGHYPSNVPKNQGVAVVWNKQLFNFEKSGTIGDIYNNDGNMDSPQDPWVELTTKSNGQRVMVLAIHSPNDDHGNYTMRVHNGHRFLEWAQGKLGVRPYALVVVGGDFNRSGNDETGGRSNQGAYCVLTSTGQMQQVYDKYAGKSKSNNCPTSDVSKISKDQIYVSTNIPVSVPLWKNMLGTSPDTMGTDHSPVFAKVKVTKQ